MATQERPETSTINGNEYYNVHHLKEYDPAYFYGSIKTTKNIIGKKNIPEDQYIYATYNGKKDEWKVYDKKNNVPTKAIIYISKEWIESNMPKMAINDDNDEDDEHEDNKEVKVNNGDNYEDAPNIIQLDDEEKFTDSDGNIVEIETRGYRSYDQIYFLAKDIANAFEIKSLNNTISKKDTGYIENIHYKNFLTQSSDKVPSKGKKKNVKTLFITYKGMLKVLFGSRSGNADKFVDWATKTLFTAQWVIKMKKKNWHPNY